MSCRSDVVWWVAIGLALAFGACGGGSRAEPGLETSEGATADAQPRTTVQSAASGDGDEPAATAGAGTDSAGSPAASAPARLDAGADEPVAAVRDSGALDAATSPSDAGDAATSACSGPTATFSGELATGINFVDDEGERVNAHGGGIIKVGEIFYLHGERFSSATTDNNFVGFSMYSSDDLAHWHNEGLILPQQPSGELGPGRKGERPHIIKCPTTGEFVLYAHAASADYQSDKEVVYATSPVVNGQYSYRGPLKDENGKIVAHSDISAYTDETGAYVLTESGHVYTLAEDCHSWVSDTSVPAINGDSGGAESPTVFKAGNTYYWIGSYKTGWRANNNFYSTAPSIKGPWTYQGFLAPVEDRADRLSDERTWLSQSTWVQPVVGCSGTLYLYWGDHWDGNQDTSAPGRHNAMATYVFQPLVFDGKKISLPMYRATWTLDVGAGVQLP